MQPGSSCIESHPARQAGEASMRIPSRIPAKAREELCARVERRAGAGRAGPGAARRGPCCTNGCLVFTFLRRVCACFINEPH